MVGSGLHGAGHLVALDDEADEGGNVEVLTVLTLDNRGGP